MNQLQVIEHQNQRALTTAQLAESYETDERRISENYTRNRERYTEGKHYFSLEGEQKREFLNHTQIADSLKHAPTIYLWTEKGAWLHAKSLNTDRAWEAYETLVDDYYRIRNNPQLVATTPTEALLYAAQILAHQEQQLKLLEATTTRLSHRLDNIDSLDTIGDLQQRLNAMVRRYAQQEGLSFPGAWKSFKQSFNVAFHTNITMLAENYKMKHGLSKITVPQYLSLTGKLEDAIRVADKLLNRVA